MAELTRSESDLVNACAVLEAIKPYYGLTPYPIFAEAWTVAMERAALAAKSFVDQRGG